MLKNLLISLSYFIGIILISTLIFTIFNYFNILTDRLNSILKLLIPIISIAISSYILGTKSIKKGYLEGIKLSLIIIIIFILISITFSKFNIKSLIYYLILITTSTLSSMIGINRKKAS